MSSSTPPRQDAERPPDLREAQGPGGDGEQRGARGKGSGTLAELPLLIVAALVLAFLIKTFLVQAFYIPSGSMEPTLDVGDRVLVEKISYHYRSPERGEVIVFRRPGAQEVGGTSVRSVVRSFLEGLGFVQPSGDIDLIKRVIGLPGETVAVRGGRVFVNGKRLREPYGVSETRDFPRTRVPRGQLFMMGDNRPNSDDSRFSLGTVPMGNVVGRAFVILWPPGNAAVRLDRDYPGVGEGRAAALRPARPHAQSAPLTVVPRAD